MRETEVLKNRDATSWMIRTVFKYILTSQYDPSL